jgi:hypothetical protein
MDYLLVLLAIGGLVVAGVMLVLASRASRMERESDERVHELEALATGAVLFGGDATDELDEFTPARPAMVIDAFADFDDEAADERVDVRPTEAPRLEPSISFDAPASAYPFVLTVPAGGGPLAGSFERNNRSRS